MRRQGQADPPGRLRSLADRDPTLVAAAVSWSRVAIGAVMVLAPRQATRPGLGARDASPDAVTAWRVAGARDLALGLGALLAARHASPALRGWLEAGALADAADVYAFGRDTAFRPLVRAGAVLAAAAGATAGMWSARRLSG
ncbi:MAG TPA: hypothetical protein VM287_08090 [Egibacteraceae bacterium]|nr:hypothetical protein [Egibacteraceae bacterium]